MSVSYYKSLASSLLGRFLLKCSIEGLYSSCASTLAFKICCLPVLSFGRLSIIYECGSTCSSIANITLRRQINATLTCLFSLLLRRLSPSYSFINWIERGEAGEKEEEETTLSTPSIGNSRATADAAGKHNTLSCEIAIGRPCDAAVVAESTLCQRRRDIIENRLIGCEWVDERKEILLFERDQNRNRGAEKRGGGRPILIDHSFRR